MILLLQQDFEESQVGSFLQVSRMCSHYKLAVWIFVFLIQNDVAVNTDIGIFNFGNVLTCGYFIGALLLSSRISFSYIFSRHFKL